MRCPMCVDQELHVTVRDGIETDHCPRCRGVWLDRGELDKLLDLAESRQASGWVPSTPPRGREEREPARDDARGGHRDARPDPRDRYDDRDRFDRGRDDDRDRGRRKRRGGFASLLEDVFEGFD